MTEKPVALPQPLPRQFSICGDEEIDQLAIREDSLPDNAKCPQFQIAFSQGDQVFVDPKRYTVTEGTDGWMTIIRVSRKAINGPHLLCKGKRGGGFISPQMVSGWERRMALPSSPVLTWTNLPDEQTWYWHWNGDDYSVPHIYSVMVSKTGRDRYFIANGGAWCDEFGGFWLKIARPNIPSREEQIALKSWAKSPNGFLRHAARLAARKSAASSEKAEEVSKVERED